MKMLALAWLGGACFGVAGAIWGAYWLVKTDEEPRNTAQRAWWN